MLCSVTFFSENRSVYEIMSKKCAGASEAADYIAHERFKLDK
jgi:hypothetical protein